MSYVTRPDVFPLLVEQTLRNIEGISLGTLETVTGKELSGPGDTELSGVEFIHFYQDLAARGILEIGKEIQEGVPEADWVDRWSEQYDREVEKLGLV